MKKLVILFALLMAVWLPAQLDVAETQYFQTDVGWFVYFRTTNYYLWPMTNFGSWELVISRNAMGYHPPYIGAYLKSDLNVTDPEFRLPCRLESGEYHYRLVLYTAQGYVVSQTPELLLTITEPEVPTCHTGYVCHWEPVYTTAVALQSTSPTVVTVTVRNEHGDVVYSSPEAFTGLKFLWLHDLVVNDVFMGWFEFSSDLPFSYTAMVFEDGRSSITYTGGVE